MARSHIAQVSGSTSSGVGSRPASLAPIQVAIEIWGPKARVKSSSRPPRAHGGADLLDIVAEGLEQRRGVARGLLADRVERGALQRGLERQAHAQAPGLGRCRARRMGRCGGGAQVASPGS